MALSKEAELALIAAARKGDADAFSDLVSEYQDRVYAGVLRQTRNADRALDIAQETFIHAWKALDTYEDRGRLGTWLYRIAMNLITSHYRHEAALKRGGSQGRASLDAEGVPEAAAATRTPAELAAAADTGDQVRRAIDELEVEFRQVVLLRDLQDFSYEEIAEMLNLAPGTVRSRLHRAREKLREKLRHLME
jgi:RNA polymerase sigma-70 factor, ECF subfamily